MPTKKAVKNTTTKEKRLTSLQRAELAEARLIKLEAKLERLVKDDTSIVRKQVRGFADFLREQSVVGLAIGLVLGTQAKQLVDQLIASFFNPFVGLLLPGQGSLDQKKAILHVGGKTAEFGWGAFIISLLTFLIVAALVYYVFKGLRLDRLKKKEG